MITRFSVVSPLIAALLLTACSKPVEPTAPVQPAAAPAVVTPPVTAAQVTAAPNSPQSAPAAAQSATDAAAPLVYPAPAAAVKPASATTRIANFAGLEADIPLSWKPVQPENSMRLAEFEAPTAGQPPAEAVVFFFPPGQGGPQDMNIARWASQFTDGKSNPVKPVVTKVIINNMAVTRIELSGSYSRGVGMGTTEGSVKANQILLAAIVTTPTQGNVTFHFFGPQASVKKQRDSFEAMLKSMRFKG